MTSPSTYVLDQSEAELDRLIFVSRFLAPAVTEACRRAGLSQGGRAIDVGCGPLGALEALVEIVGPEGSVVGVDADDAALGTASAALQRLRADGIRLIRADANDLTPDGVGISGFDLAFCRLVLMHQPDPAHTMARIASLLRPGGTLVAIDFFAPPVCFPAHAEVTRAWDLVIQAMRIRGASPDTSRRYREFCARAGLEVVSERGQFFPIPAAAVVSEAAVLLAGARSTIERSGLCSSAEVDGLLAALRTDQLPAGSAAYSPQAIELIARTPPAA
ncbi:MAG TPA: class I SAM-dependent methyltransferase [Streptosporangiaceae bacterium]